MKSSPARGVEAGSEERFGVAGERPSGRAGASAAKEQPGARIVRASRVRTIRFRFMAFHPFWGEQVMK
jgi:hypothetical protein